MKKTVHKVLALLLAACVVTGSVSAALGEETFRKYLTISDTIRLYTGTQVLFGGAKGENPAQEHYLTYSPDEDVWPIVVGGQTVSSTETMSTLAKKLSKEGLAFVAGVNGSFFELQTGVPYGLVVTEGVIRSASVDAPTVGFFDDGTAIIGSPELTVDLLTYDDARTELFVNKQLSKKNGIGLYTPDFGEKTRNTLPAYHVILQPEDKDDTELTMDGSLELRVTGMMEDSSSCQIPEDGFVLCIAENTVYPSALENMRELEIGDTVYIETNCDKQWRDVVYACSGSELLVEDGEALDDFTLDSAKKSAARTAVGVNEKGGLLLYTVDCGENSQGMTLDELAERMEEIGCVTALNLDGGGSTTLGVTYPGYDGGATVNRPEDGALRACPNYIFFVRELTRAEEASQLYLYPYGTQPVLPGAKVTLTVKAVDAWYQPAELPDEIEYEAIGGSVSEKGVLTVSSDADDYVTVEVTSGELSAAVELPVATDITRLTILREDNDAIFDKVVLPGGSKTELTAQAFQYGRSVLSGDSSFDWEIDGDIGVIDASGTFIAAQAEETVTGTIRVSCGDAVAEAEVTVAPKNPFADMKGHWAQDYVSDLFFSGVLTGSEDKSGNLYYRPNDSMTRQEFIVALMRFLQVDPAQYSRTELPFADNEKISGWAEDAMKAAYSLKLLSGSSSDGKVYARPLATISRQEAMVILARAQKLGDSKDTYVLKQFKDADRIADWARQALAAMVEKKIISGSDGKLNPTGNVKRAEVAKMLYALRHME